MKRLREGYDSDHDGLLIGKWLDRDGKRRPVNWIGSAHENAYNWVGHGGIKRIRSRRQIESSSSNFNQSNMGCCYEILPARALKHWWLEPMERTLWLSGQCGIWKYYFHFTSTWALKHCCLPHHHHVSPLLCWYFLFHCISINLITNIDSTFYNLHWLKFNYA